MPSPLLAVQYDLFATPAQTLSDGRLTARAIAEAVTNDDERLALARAFCEQAVAAYWSTIPGAPGLRQSFRGYLVARLTFQAQSLAADLGKAARGLTTETAFYELGRLYNTMLPPTFRARLGVYYTPPELVERLLDQATAAGVDWLTCRVLDPACGGGAFLAPVARRMLTGLRTYDQAMALSSLAVRLQGFEIDPFAAWLSQVALDAVVIETLGGEDSSLPDCIQVCDALVRPDPAAEQCHDLVIGNPPYGRLGLDAEQRMRFRRSLYGHANLYGIFTDLALRHARAGGIVAYVTPTSFLAGHYFKELRHLLAQEAPPVSLDFVDARKGVFDDVLQETLLAVYRKDGTASEAMAVTVSRGADGCLRVNRAGRFRLPSDPSEPWLVPRNAAQAELLATATAMPARLRHWGYSVSTGPLVWNRHKPQLAAERCAACLPLIWAEAVSSDGRFQFRAAKRNHLPWLRIRDRRDHWLIIKDPCVLVQRTTAKEQARRLIAAELPRAFLAEHGGAVVENHLNMVRPDGPTPPVSASTVTAFLGSRAVDALFRCINGSVAVSAFELEALPLPEPGALHRLEALVRDQAGRDEIDAECARLYQMEQL
jgi:adenine-specific DNA-methyltransferase